MTTVVIADDHPPTRAGVRQALEDGGISVVGEASNADDAIELVREHSPDAALLDIHMPGNGIHAARVIGDEAPEVAVVMLTVSDSSDDLFDALRAGASGYLLKDTDPERLPHALRGVIAGESAMPRHLVARLMVQFRAKSGRRLPGRLKRRAELTDRETEVLDLMVEGLSTVEMAERLFVSQVTVRSHVSSILKKLDAPDRATAIDLLKDEP